MLTDDSFSSGTFAIELGKYQVETVENVSGLALEQDEPGAHRSSEITITRGMDKSTAFTDWIKATLVNGDLDGARQNITITLQDSKKRTVHRIHLSNAWASRWEGPSLEASESDPPTEQVTIAYEDITVE
ncbi:phage tail protein [Streptomyces sp. NPDC017988]|uniref:phage tail protein n=1 Tax=Streptomyces sp. NPDC017988 TaxID=3365025 RepID=UPI0037A9CEDB